MTRAPGTWWHGLTGADKFRVYSRVTLQVTLLGVAVAMAVSAAEPVALVGLLAAAVVAVAVVEVQPGLTSRPTGRGRRPLLVVGVAVPALVWMVCAVLAVGSDADDVDRAASVTAVFVVLTLAMSVLAFAPHRWWWMVGLAVLTGAVFGTTWPMRATFAALTAGIGVFVLGSMIVTLATVRIVDDLERARSLEARLRVADERLRFARDLHDVVGRGFSAVAVKSELAATLARAGAADRAAAEMDAVKTLAVESMGQMRELVRGYRDIDLPAEVAGARSLLSAIGCDLVVEGDPQRLPAAYVELAAWATREGTTNIVKHASATTAVLAFGDAGMTLRNDGVPAEQHARSGLRGLAERADQVGATLTTTVTEEEFVLEIVWSPR